MDGYEGLVYEGHVGYGFSHTPELLNMSVSLQPL